MKKSTFLLLFLFLLAACGGQDASVRLIDPPEDDEDTITNINPTAGVPQTKGARTLVWNDEFSNNFDFSKWEVMTGDGSQFGIPGWGNNEQQYYQQSNISVEDSSLVITAREQSLGGKAYTSARIRTINKGDWTYGWFEARIKLPEAQQGMWPAFWMLPSSTGSVWPDDGEIDIMEWVAKDANTIHGTIHFSNNGKDQRGGTFSAGQSFANTWHVYAIEWTATTITWYIDDQAYYAISASAAGAWPFTQPFHFLLNLAVGGNLPGNTDASTQLPQRYEVDYVRVYQKDGEN